MAGLIEEKGKFQYVKVDDIDISEENVRKEKVKEGLKELAENIKAVGLLQPIVVYEEGERYKLIIGQRRFLALKEILGEKEIKAIVIEKLDSISALLLSLGENLARRELSYSDKDKAINLLYDEYGSPKKVAEITGFSVPTIYEYIKDRVISDELKEMMEKEGLSRDKARQITKVYGPDTSKAVEMAKKSKKVPRRTASRAISITKRISEERGELISPDEAIKEAKKPQEQVSITVVLDLDYWKALKDASKERALDIVDTARNAIIDWLEDKGYT